MIQGEAMALVYDENTWVNPVTGEIRHEEKHKPRNTEKLFVKMYRIQLRKIRSQLKGHEFAVLDYILDYFDTSDNHLKATMKDVATALKISSASIARCFRKLKKLDCIRYVRDGEWMVNPYIAMYGDSATKQRRLYAEFIEYEKFVCDDEEDDENK